MFLQSVNSLSHYLWKSILFPGAYIIDATCGNGHDTLYLAHNTLTEHAGLLVAMDIQSKAIMSTESLLKENFKKNILQKIKLVESCHSQIDFHCQKEVDLIVYNLGYLPGSDKSITTQTQTTLKSLQSSLHLLKKGGYLSITCYPGHVEGQFEASSILKWAKSLGVEYDCCQHTWINRSEKAPFILLIHKKKTHF